MSLCLITFRRLYRSSTDCSNQHPQAYIHNYINLYCLLRILTSFLYPSDGSNASAPTENAHNGQTWDPITPQSPAEMMRGRHQKAEGLPMLFLFLASRGEKMPSLLGAKQMREVAAGDNLYEVAGMKSATSQKRTGGVFNECLSFYPQFDARGKYKFLFILKCNAEGFTMFLGQYPCWCCQSDFTVVFSVHQKEVITQISAYFCLWKNQF